MYSISLLYAIIIKKNSPSFNALLHWMRFTNSKEKSVTFENFNCCYHKLWFTAQALCVAIHRVQTSGNVYAKEINSRARKDETMQTANVDFQMYECNLDFYLFDLLARSLSRFTIVSQPLFVDTHTLSRSEILRFYRAKYMKWEKEKKIFYFLSEKVHLTYICTSL